MPSYNFVKAELFSARIMIVDDNAINVRVVQAHLQKAGFSVFETACDGVDTLAKIDHFQPDLLVLDLLMPNMDGFEVIRHLRARPQYEQLPIIVQTALTNPEEQNEAWSSGASDIVTKPIHPLELISRVFVQLRQSYLLRALTEYQHSAEEDIAESLELQKSLLPDKKSLATLSKNLGIKFDYIYMPCRFLSGDLWGIHPIADDKMAIWIADFTGKGIRASLNTFRLHAYLQKLNVDYLNPSAVLEELNQRLNGVLKRGTFATFLYGVLDVEKNVFSYASAGSSNPIIYNRSLKTMSMLDAKGVPLGIDPGIRYPTLHAEIIPDSSFLFYSDFLWESYESLGISFEEERLCEAIVSLNGNYAVDVMKDVVKAQGDHLVLSDDFTLLEVSLKK